MYPAQPSTLQFADDVVDPDYDMPAPNDPIPDPLDHTDYKIVDGLGKRALRFQSSNLEVSEML